MKEFQYPLALIFLLIGCLCLPIDVRFGMGIYFIAVSVLFMLN